MNTVSNHAHGFAPAEWPFAVPSNSVAFTNTRVLHENHPILLVSHDFDGDWQFLCGADDPGECLLICLGCAYQRGVTVGAVAAHPVQGSMWGKLPEESAGRQAC
jgi:hypothetical protein